jgi:hypothetical protein
MLSVSSDAYFHSVFALYRRDKAAQELDAEIEELLAEKEITGRTIRAATAAMLDPTRPALQAELATCAAVVAEAVADAGADTAQADAAQDVLNDQTALPEGSLTTALTPFARADAADLAAQKAGAGGARFSFQRLLLDDDYDLDDASLDPAQEVVVAQPAVVGVLGSHREDWDIDAFLAQQAHMQS